ncbi:MAG: ChaN family lipoprotein [Candidatus Rifleibacteriota bacterium]
MKRLFKLAIILALVAAVPAFTEEIEWQPHKLPFGNESSRWNMTQVFLHSVIDSQTGKTTDMESFYQKLEEADVILIGESHTGLHHHQVQQKIIEALAERGNQLVIGLEMYNEQQNQKLDEYIREGATPEAFAASTGYYSTWGHNLRYYMPIFAAAHRYQIPLRGVNLPSERVKALRKAGLNGLTEAILPGESMPDTSSSEHRFFIETMMQGLGAQAPEMFPGIYLAQCLWDAAMAQGIVKAAEEFSNHKIIGLAGTGHVAYGLGIARLIKNRSNLKVVTVMPVDIKIKSKKKTDEHPGFAVHMGKKQGQVESPFTIVSAGLADFLVGVPEEKNDFYPAPPFKVSEKEGKLLIGSVMPGTWAFKAGFRSGDEVIRVAGTSFKKADQLNYFLHHLNWNQQLSLTIKRNGKTIGLQKRLTIEKKS